MIGMKTSAGGVSQKKGKIRYWFGFACMIGCAVLIGFAVLQSIHAPERCPGNVSGTQQRCAQPPHRLVLPWISFFPALFARKNPTSQMASSISAIKRYWIVL
jgi:hypothetical protein